MIVGPFMLKLYDTATDGRMDRHDDTYDHA